jgi:hypothetical protein
LSRQEFVILSIPTRLSRVAKGMKVNLLGSHVLKQRHAQSLRDGKKIAQDEVLGKRRE